MKLETTNGNIVSMVTVILEIKNHLSFNVDFYNPAIPECKKGCRSIEATNKAIEKLQKYAEAQSWIEAYKIKIYAGAYESYKNCELIFETQEIYKEVGA